MTRFREMMKGRPLRRPFSLVAAMVCTGFTLCMPAMALAETRGYIVTSFATIRVEAPVHIVLKTGEGTTARGEGDGDLLERVNLSVSGRVLTVRFDGGPDIGFDPRRNIEAPVITLSTEQIKRAQILGGATLRIDKLKGLEAELSLSGNGEMTVDDADIERLSLYVGGGGRMTLAGKARDVRASANGPGAIEAEKLVARNATIANDGVGFVHISVDGPAKVVATGSGDTVVGGKAICSVTRRGTGSVTCGE